MKNDKWYIKTLIYLMIAVFSPLLLIGFVFFGIASLIKIPSLKREYKKSRYFADVKRKFNLYVALSDEYRFYNSAAGRELTFDYHRQDSNGFEYFIYDGTLFLFPDFSEISFDEETGKWRAVRNDEEADFSECFRSLEAKLDSAPGIPVKVLCELKQFQVSNLNRYTLPGEIYLTSCYEHAFSEDDAPMEIIVPLTTRDLYCMMEKNRDLCGSCETKLDENGYGSVFWTLDGARFELVVGHGQGYIGVSVGEGEFRKIETHWHPNPDAIYDAVMGIGKRGNITVLCSDRFFGGAQCLYSGKKEDCPYLSPRKRLFKKYYYIEAK